MVNLLKKLRVVLMVMTTFFWSFFASAQVPPSPPFSELSVGSNHFILQQFSPSWGGPGNVVFMLEMGTGRAWNARYDKNSGKFQFEPIPYLNGTMLQNLPPVE